MQERYSRDAFKHRCIVFRTHFISILILFVEIDTAKVEQPCARKRTRRCQIQTK